MNRTKLLFLCLLPFLIILSACGDATINLDKDGSGKMEIEFPNNEYYDVDDVKSEFEANMDDRDGFSKLSVKEKKDKIIASFQFSKLNDLDSYAYRIPVADFVITEHSKLDELNFVEEDKEFNDKIDEIFVELPSEIEEFNSAKIILPGKIVAHSLNLDVIEKDTVEMTTYGNNYVVYSPSNFSSLIVWGIVLFALFIFIVLVVGLIVFLIIKKKKNDTSNNDENKQEIKTNQNEKQETTSIQNNTSHEESNNDMNDEQNGENNENNDEQKGEDETNA